MTLIPQTAAIDIEICLNCDDLTSLAMQVQAARQGGAKRLELCGVMAEQGLTPVSKAVEIARQAWGDAPGLVAMLRPRGGDFFYQAADVVLLQQQLPALAAAGADAVVLGMLRHSSVGTEGGQVDIDWALLTTLLAQAVDLGLEVNFHRAFDVLPMTSRAAALQRLQLLGVARVLTAGCAWQSHLGAIDGIAQLQQDLAQRMQAQAPRLVIGGGVTLRNVAALRQQLLPGADAAACYSFHCYSAVLTDGLVEQHKVAALVQAAALSQQLC